ncbi:hypothetical protein [Ktedonobacter racemifer]|uniref:Uncharacterized protein n=1 Tax=Ktedonobacter racemifer DSM 44963 TaxID=485913 RepID=D6TIY2_KTERA|nr:hypothetical protein [Ktedonobacter racemifer]EFH89389.1 hypothetical protein Krac_10942 [Ktedonobacter racemifer DSM 44963]
MAYSPLFASWFLPAVMVLLAMLVVACGSSGSGANGSKASDDQQIYVFPPASIFIEM